MTRFGPTLHLRTLSVYGPAAHLPLHSGPAIYLPPARLGQVAHLARCMVIPDAYVPARSCPNYTALSLHARPAPFTSPVVQCAASAR